MTSDVLGSFTIPVEHGLIYAHDQTSEQGHLGWDGTSSPYEARGDSIVIGVRADVDGPVTVEVRGGEDALAHEYFAGEIDTPSRRLMVHDADDVATLMIVLPAEVTRIRLSGDAPRDPGHVLISLPDR